MSTCRSEKGKSTSIAAVHIFCTVKSQFFYFGQFGQIFRTSPRKCGTPYIFRRKRKWDFSSSLKLPNYFLVTIRRKSKLQMLLSWILPSYWLTNQGLQDSCLSLTLGKAIQNHLSYFLTKYFFVFYQTALSVLLRIRMSVSVLVPVRSRKIAILSLIFYGKSLWS